MKFNFKPINIRTKVLILFSVFTLFVLGIMWLFQVLFLESIYNNQKKDEIEKYGKNIEEVIDSGDINSLINNLSFGNNINIYIIDDIDGIGRVLLPLEIASSRDNCLKEELFQIMKTKLNEAGNTNTTYKLADFSYVYASVIEYGDNDVYLYISSPLEHVKQTISLLSYQLLIITIVVIFLSFALSVLFSNNISKPVIQMSKSAKKLAKRDFKVNFEGSSYTEINELANTLNYAKKELMKSDDMQKQLIANVSHDLKTPLTMIKAYAEMIRDISGDDKEKRNKDTKIIIEETDRLAILVNDILNISKAGTGLDNFEKKEENLSEIVLEIIEKFNVLEVTGNYNFIVDVDTDLFTVCNKDKIEQVLYNLIANAVNYTGEDCKVFVNLKLIDNKIKFEVRDTGKGIPKEQLDNIWDKYYRSVETHKRPIKGSGLGLSIVKSILTAHEFNFGVTSEVDKGSCFYIIFPAL